MEKVFPIDIVVDKSSTTLTTLIIKSEFLISLNAIKVCDKNDTKFVIKKDATSGMEKVVRTITAGTQAGIIISSNEFYTFKTKIQQETGKLRKEFVDKVRQSSPTKALEFRCTRLDDSNPKLKIKKLISKIPILLLIYLKTEFVHQNSK